MNTSETNKSWDPVTGPFSNKFNTKPKDDYVRCLAFTREGVQCKCCATKGSDVCFQHKAGCK